MKLIICYAIIAGYKKCLRPEIGRVADAMTNHVPKLRTKKLKNSNLSKRKQEVICSRLWRMETLSASVSISSSVA